MTVLSCFLEAYLCEILLKYVCMLVFQSKLSLVVIGIEVMEVGGSNPHTSLDVLKKQVDVGYA